jgi:hypothetical protein
MSDSTAKMSWMEKAPILLGGLSAAIAFAVLILGDNALRLTYKPDIYLNTDTVALESLGGSKEYIRLFDFYNSGTAASTNIKVVARFSTPDLKFTVESDEEVKSSASRSSLVEISLDRFSPRSHLKVSVLSKAANPLIETYYIDDKGKTKIDPERRSDNQDQWIKMTAILAVVFVVFWIAIVFMKRWESRIAANWQSATRELGDKMDQLKSDVAELRGATDDGSRNAAPSAGAEINGAVEERLQNLLNP